MTTVTSGLPSFIAIKHHGQDVYLKYEANTDDPQSGIPVLGGNSVFDTLGKIAVEPSANGGANFHLRFCQSNRYLELSVVKFQYLFVARSKQPEEDTTKESCTLFKSIIVNDEGLFQLIHVQTGYLVQVSYPNLGVYSGSNDPTLYDHLAFYYRDWDALVKMPARVAFKGDNGKFLEGVVVNNNPFLKFSSDDSGAGASGHEVQLMADGRVWVKSNHFNKFWRRSPNWIWADAAEAKTGDADTLFSVVKIDNTTVALRNSGNNNFCKRLTAENNDDCLNAGVATITTEAKLGVQELVSARRIYDVVYRLDDARIADQQPYKAGSTTLHNDTDFESSQQVSITYEDTKSYTFSRSVSLTAGVTTTIEAGLPFIESLTIEVSLEVSGALEWDDTTETKTSVTATGSVTIPARSAAVIDYIGTQGTCNVPYSYKQEDTSSTDGQITHTELIDGIYNGVNCYNFDFRISEINALP